MLSSTSSLFSSASRALGLRTFATGTNLISSGPTELFTSGDKVKTEDLFKDKKVLVVGVVGAFTPTCQNQIPEFSKNIKDFSNKVDSVVVSSVNDPLAMSAWQKSVDPNNSLTFIADFDASLTKTLGLDIDLSVVGLGIRSHRYFAVIDNGIVTHEEQEDSPGELNKTSASSILSKL